MRALGEDWATIGADFPFAPFTEEDGAHAGAWGSLPTPTHPDDWLAQYKETSQSYPQWQRLRNQMITKQRKKNGQEARTIYLIVIGSVPTSLIEPLLQYTEAFYHGMPVEVLPPLLLTSPPKSGSKQVPVVTYHPPGREEDEETWEWDIPSREAHPYDLHRKRKSSRQLQVGPILDVLSHIRPKDAFCLCAVTMEDLFDGDTDSFVSGMAAGGSQVGVFSFLRYQLDSMDKDIAPSELHALGLSKNRSTKLPRGEQSLVRDRLLLRRSCKTLVHEIGHLFGLDHCIYYQCCMNGSGHLAEDFAQPMFLCPIDLRKVQELLQASPSDLSSRYRSLLDFCESQQWKGDAEWLQQRLRTSCPLNSPPKDPF